MLYMTTSDNRFAFDFATLHGTMNCTTSCRYRCSRPADQDSGDSSILSAPTP